GISQSINIIWKGCCQSACIASCPLVTQRNVHPVLLKNFSITLRVVKSSSTIRIWEELIVHFHQYQLSMLAYMQNYTKAVLTNMSCTDISISFDNHEKFKSKKKKFF